MSIRLSPLGQTLRVRNRVLKGEESGVILLRAPHVQTRLLILIWRGIDGFP